MIRLLDFSGSQTSRIKITPKSHGRWKHAQSDQSHPPCQRRSAVTWGGSGSPWYVMPPAKQASPWRLHI